MLGRWMLGGALALVVTAGAADQAPPIYRRMKGSGGGIASGSDVTLGNVIAKSYTATDGGVTIPQGEKLSLNGGGGADLRFDGTNVRFDGGLSVPINGHIGLNGASDSIYILFNTSVIDMVGGNVRINGTLFENTFQSSPAATFITMNGRANDTDAGTNVVINTDAAKTSPGFQILQLQNNAVYKRGFGISGKDIFPIGTADAVVGTATLVGGTVTVSTTAVTAGSTIHLTENTPGGVQGILSAPTVSIVAATSFVINSSSATDTSTVNWEVTN